MEKIKENRGITLVVLVITIVILLILAGMTISSLTNTGLFGKAKEAKEKTKIAGEDEQRKLAQTEALMSTEKTAYKGITLPEGFAPTKIDGENSVDDGLVIIDGKGNEYVWIEVPKTIYHIAKSNTEYENIEKDIKEYTKDFVNSNYIDEWYLGDGIGKEENYKKEKNKMLQSIYENGGFWVSRYEMSTNEPIQLSGQNVGEIYSKKNGYPYIYVTCEQAQKAAMQMNYKNYSTSLLFDMQWNLILKFINEKGGMDLKDLNEDSSLFGNYASVRFSIYNVGKYSSDYGKTYKTIENEYSKPLNEKILLTTGISERNKTKNIYDLAGNVYEWTLGTNIENKNRPAVSRGGSYNGSGLKGKYGPVSDYINNDVEHCDYGIGFRVTLY